MVAGPLLALLLFRPAGAGAPATGSSPVGGDLIQSALSGGSTDVRQRIVDAQARRQLRYQGAIQPCAALDTSPMSGGGTQPMMSAKQVCESRANAEVYGTVKAAGDAFDAAETQMYDTLAHDARVVALQEAWRACMGMPQFPDPPSIGNSFSARRSHLVDDPAGQAALSAEEASVKAKDENCQKTQVTPKYQPLLQAEQAKFLSKHQDLIDNLQQAILAS